MTAVIEINPLTRVEGHGRIEVHMTGRKVERVQLSLYESPRLFEALLLGKKYEEVPEIICRICSLCSTVHRVTALLAVEKALDINVTKQTRLYRELIVNGGHIQSHSLHLFCLVLPDYYRVSGFAELAQLSPELLALGLRIKAAGNMIQETVGGRLIHPVTLIPGGMGKPLNRGGLVRLRDALTEILPDAIQAFQILHCADTTAVPLPYPKFMAVDSAGMPTLFGSQLRMAGGKVVPVESYRGFLEESCSDESNAKWSSIDGEAITVGAAARLHLGMQLFPRASAALAECSRKLEEIGIMGNSLAQAVELIHSVETSVAILDTLIAASFERETPNRATQLYGTGSAAMEAPRGVLFHSYSFDETGRCIAADVVTPTAINQSAMKRDLLALARLLEGEKEEILRHRLEMLVRAYDPCISCAVHICKR